MLVFSGKKISNILLGVFALLLVFTFAISLSPEKAKYIDTVSLPVSGKTIVIDAGHGIPDERCPSSRWNNRSSNKFKNCSKASKFT